MKKKNIIFGGIGLCVCIVGSVWFFKNKKDAVIVKQQHLHEAQNEIQVQKDVSGITAHVLRDHITPHEVALREMDFAGEQKKWIIVQIPDRDAWDVIDSEKKKDILRGLINTSRLQGDNDFGGVQIKYGDAVVMQGWWDVVKKYVIL